MGLSTSGWFSGSGKVTKTVGSFIPGVGDADAQKDANEANIEQAEINRAFQERMSNTSYERGIADMKKAGINPLLAYMQGGASAPSGSQATVSAAPRTGLADAALKATTGISSMRNQTTGVQQQGMMNESSIQLNKSTAAKQIAEVARTEAETQKTQVETAKARKDLPAAALQGQLADKGGKLVNKILKSMESTPKDMTFQKFMKAMPWNTPKTITPNKTRSEIKKSYQPQNYKRN